MDIKMHGRRIQYIELDPRWTEGGNPESVGRYDDIDLKLSATHHGDHDQFWVIASRNGMEIARYNVRGIQHIVWWSPESESDE